MATPEELEARIAALEARMQRVEDIENIKRLQRAYGYYLDKGLWDEVVRLFAPDGTAEIAQRGVFRGPERIRVMFHELIGKGVDGLPDGRLLNHMQLQAIITLGEDGRHAEGRWRAFIMAGDHGGDGLWAEGPYEMRYVKGDDDVWRISRLLWFPTFYADYAKGWAGDARPANPVSDRIPPDAPPTHDYEIFPAYHVPPFHYPNPGGGDDQAT
ncbi:MAG: nuclear transport factor 2 family protein [Pseudooceanicola sp.]